MFKSNSLRKIISILFMAALLLSNFQTPAVVAQGQDGLKYQKNAQTGKVSFIGPEKGKALPAAQALGVLPGGAHPADPALALAKRFAPEFGLRNPGQELKEIRQKQTEDGRITARYQQEYQGIPVMGGELIVNTNEDGDLYSINGEVSSDLSLSTQPTIDSAQARDTALQALAKWYQKDTSDFVTTEPELWIFDESLLGSGTRPAELVWRMDVTPKDAGMPVRELVLVNAERGSISLHFNQIDTAWGDTQQPQVENPTPMNANPVDDHNIYINSSAENIPALVTITWYVDTTGDDSNSCSSTGSPCATINGAIGKAAAGDTIKVAIGIYTGSGTEVVQINKSITLSGGWDASFTSQSGTSIIDGQESRKGVLLVSGTVGMDHFTIQNGLNHSLGGLGGGIRNNGTLTLSNSIVKDNVSDVGGGIYNSGILTIYETTISGNTAGQAGYSGSGGGGGIENHGTVILYKSTVNGNTIVGFFGGSGILNGYGTVTLNNSTVSGNTGGSGDGILNTDYYGSILLNNSTISYNQAYGINTMGGNVTFQNTIISSNGIYGDCYKYTGIIIGTITSQGYNLIGKNTGCSFIATSGDLIGTSVSPINAYLTPLQGNGGPTFTHALMEGSPAIDAGNPAAPGSGGGACEANDQRGVVRPNGAHCDIGAYEGSVPLSLHPLASTFNANLHDVLPGSFLCNQSQLNCTNGVNPHADAAHTYAIGTYYFYATNFNRDSMDKEGMPIISSVHYCSPYACPYANAYWDGKQMVYGDVYGFPLADDVVAHELTHGVTQYESNLFYFYQSGAINESFSDLWGEYYDQINGQGYDAENVKWLLGENVSGLGAVRSMKNPPAYGDPDKMTSSLYKKSLSDNGGIHHNSGVNNKAVYLMVDGGTFNNQTITALGWEKVGAIYYEANTNLLFSGADYSDLYYALLQACSNLINQHGITSADCLEAKDALDAVQMNNSLGSFNPEAALCPKGMVTDPSFILFADDLESGFNNWATSGGSAWTSAYGYASSGTYMFWGRDNFNLADARLTLTSSVTIPPGRSFLHFKHAYLFDYFIYQGTPYYFDGGVLEYSVNGGSTWKDAKPLFSAGKKYSGTIYPYSGNPLKNRSAFVGDSHGYVSSRYDLSSLAGQTVQFRWRLGTDSEIAFLGWFVDDVQIYSCVPVPAIPTLLAPVNGVLLTNYAAPLLDWSDTLTGLHHYQVQVADENTFAAPLYDDDTLASEYLLPGVLTPNTQYFWRVRSFNSLDATQGWSAVFSFRAAILPAVLSAPDHEASLTTRRPAFDWEDVDGATGYKLVISKYANLSSPLKVLSVVNSEYLPTFDLPAKTKLFWRVQALGPNGPRWSDTRWFKTGNPPSVPVLKAPANNALVKDYTPKLDWSTSSLPSGTTFQRYELQVDDNNDFSSPEIIASTPDGALSQSVYIPGSDLASNTKYYWRVRAVNEVVGVEHFSGWSKVWAFRAAMLPPTLLLPANMSTEVSLQPLFDWEDVVGATSYTIQISTDKKFGTFLVNKTVNGSTFTPTKNLPKNKTIYWRVRANGPNGPSNWSTFRFITRP
jgi:Zn-dependent metalloprotease